MKRKYSNFVGILSDQGEAAIALNLSEYTIHYTGQIIIDHFIKKCIISKNFRTSAF